MIIRNDKVCKEDIVYRVTYRGVGIYEAFKKAIHEDPRYNMTKMWLNFITNKNINGWLKNPGSKIYGSSSYKAKSYFTYDGYLMFTKKVLPEITKVLYKDDIDIEEIPITTLDKKYSRIYSDDYQIIYV